MIYDNILSLCKLSGITISQLERDVGLSHGAIYKWKTCSPRVFLLSCVADYFGVTVDYLLGRREAD